MKKLKEYDWEIFQGFPQRSHICHFYETPEELKEILVPFFLDGLRKKERCIWIVEESLGKEEALEALGESISNLENFIQKGQLLLHNFSDWYPSKDSFQSFSIEKPLHQLEDAAFQALEDGYRGLRISGSFEGLPEGLWPEWMEYEYEVDHLIEDREIQAICSYNKNQLQLFEILEVTKKHGLVLAKERGAWKLMESVEQKKIRHLVESWQENFRLVFENLNVGVVRTDLRGVILESNQAFGRFLGYSTEELKGKSLSSFTHPEDLEKQKKQLEAIQKGNSNHYHLEKRFLHKNGSIVWGNKSLSLLAFGQGRSFCIAIITDITDRKKSEEELQRKNRQMENLLKNVKVIIMEGTCEKITFISGQVEEILGYSIEDWHGHPEGILGFWRDHIHPKEQVETVQFCLRETNALRDHTMEYRMISKTGKILWFHDTVTVEEQKEGLPFLRSTMVDITKQKEDEVETQRSLKEKELLLQELHHRVKNNMQIISSLMNLQKKYLQNFDMEDFLLNTKNRIQSMALVHEKIYKSKNLSTMDLKQYIESLCMELFRTYEIQRSKVTLQLEIEKISMEIDHAVPCGLILNEILSNALKYAFPGNRKGWIRISLKEMDSGKIELQVQDNGIGLPREVDFTEEKTLGVKLIALLTEQLPGTFAVEREGGTLYKIIFEGKRKST